MALYPCQTNAFTTESTEFAERSSEKLFSFFYVLCINVEILVFMQKILTQMRREQPALGGCLRKVSFVRLLRLGV